MRVDWSGLALMLSCSQEVPLVWAALLRGGAGRWIGWWPLRRRPLVPALHLQSSDAPPAPLDPCTPSERMSNPSDTKPRQPPTGEALDHLAHLRKMTATAGVALGEYRAVNVLAVTSLVLGVASWMSLLHPLLFLLPIGGVCLALIAVMQIRRSNGTQSGRALAAIGLLLALGLGGWALASNLASHSSAERHRDEIRTMLNGFGTALAAADYETAYTFTSANFRREIDLDRFRSEMSLEVERLGGIRGTSTNELARVTQDAAGVATAEAILLVDVGFAEPLRQEINLVHEEGGWRIQEFQVWFPRAGRPRRPR